MWRGEGKGEGRKEAGLYGEDVIRGRPLRHSKEMKTENVRGYLVEVNVVEVKIG